MIYSKIIINLIVGLSFITVIPVSSSAQAVTATGILLNDSNKEQGIIALSKEKWKWMADKKVDTLKSLFHDKSVFVHMGGSWGKDRELDVIKSGGIHYKQADIFETTAQLIGNTAIVLTRIRLLAVVGGNEVTNPFMVTEVYIAEGNAWKMGSLSFTRLMGQ
ncbi:nuclear transport factor 2 family protein [Paraflavitalea pollutisoli]|uniref:nuclear transport factor 2 family protein n=1 Tax=Paraflavitalea pollutisoli TaxID=3034143 RepID=UPI0023ED2A8D|nr:nuclear transport factor 2 family protein [Paraflavitalea sp. H1-2-19X]